MSHPAILHEGSSAWAVLPVDRAAALIDGEDYFRAFYEAALGAQRSILLSGWQFDSDACLLRGDDVAAAPGPVELLKFLEWLCAERPQLHIHMLAWNFHVVFAMEREWLQELVFNWKTNDRIHFHFDGHHPDGASHHQKFAVIDGWRSFLGGLDLCDHRWDRRAHCEPDIQRMSHGGPHKPFHDAQIYLEGAEVGAALTSLFHARWNTSGGKPELPAVGLGDLAPKIAGGAAPPGWSPRDGVPIPARHVALSRTDPNGAPAGPSPCREVEELHLLAIATAQRHIYIETQYFSSRAIGEALVARLADTSRPLEIVIVTNPSAESPKEDIAVGLAQAKVLRDLRRAARGTPHTLGLFYSVPFCEQGEPTRATYIHAKLMVVDDLFFTLGSANLTNRSMGLDSELHASFEVGLGDRGLDRSSEDAALEEAIRALRCGLVREHTGLQLDDDACSAPMLLEQVARSEGRLRLHPQPTEDELEILDVVDPQALPFDPDGVENSAENRSLFVGGIGALFRKLIPGG